MNKIDANNLAILEKFNDALKQLNEKKLPEQWLDSIKSYTTKALKN
jgi:hypothetical protein